MRRCQVVLFKVKVCCHAQGGEKMAYVTLLYNKLSHQGATFRVGTKM